MTSEDAARAVVTVHHFGTARPGGPAKQRQAAFEADSRQNAAPLPAECSSRREEEHVPCSSPHCSNPHHASKFGGGCSTSAIAPGKTDGWEGERNSEQGPEGAERGKEGASWRGPCTGCRLSHTELASEPCRFAFSWAVIWPRVGFGWPRATRSVRTSLAHRNEGRSPPDRLRMRHQYPLCAFPPFLPLSSRSLSLLLSLWF